MKFIIGKAEFLKTLQRVQGIVEKRNTMPILSNVLLEAGQGRVNILATDLEVFIKDSSGADVKDNGTVTVNARKLFEIVKELPDEIVDVAANRECKVTIKGGKARFNIMGLSSKDFPVFPAMDDSKLQKVERETLSDMVDKTAFAVSLDETRYNINGFLLEKDDSLIRMVATDGHRLALIEKKDNIGIGLDAGEKKSVLLPRKGMMEIRRLLDEEAADGFLFGITEKNAVMKKDQTHINIRLLEGEFPDYKKVIPAENDKDVILDRLTLLASLKRVSILSSDKIKGVKFNLSSGRLVLTSSSPDIGDATEELDAEFKGEELEIAFNARYMIDMLEAIDDEKVKLRLRDSLSPGIISAADTGEYTYIIMPMRL
jgi:DNA polymerase-3 subunit beta